MGVGGVMCNTSWLFDEECLFGYSRHEATAGRAAFVCVNVGGGSGYHYMSIPTVAVMDRLIDTLIEARAWLAAHETRDRDDHSNHDAAAAGDAARRVELAPAGG